jgi:hypothetical protein
MKNKNSVTKEPATGASTGKKDSTVEVLYQKMGDRWFAFSLVEEEVFVGSISQEEIDYQKGPSQDPGADHSL